MPHLAKIHLYPIKSLDGVEVTEATLLPGGGLAQDREFALFDGGDRLVNAKRTEQMHRIRSTFDLMARTVTLGVQGEYERQTFSLDGDQFDGTSPLEVWFSDYLGYPVYLRQNVYTGFPDDLDAAGPTVVSTATLETIATWFPGTTLEEMRRRFRANLELGGVPAFWEEQLYEATDTLHSFQIGDVTLLGDHPCQRCVVPTRDSQTGDRTRDFQNRFIAKRSETLPDWAPIASFNHYYKLTVNTKVAESEAGKALRVGDEVH